MSKLSKRVRQSSQETLRTETEESQVIKTAMFCADVARLNGLPNWPEVFDRVADRFPAQRELMQDFKRVVNAKVLDKNYQLMTL